jgi:Flp pilus assembly pilin Flp
VIQSSAAAIEDVLISGVSEVRIGGTGLELEGKVDGIWEAVANAETGSLLSPATATELLKVLGRLSDSSRS